MKVLHICAIAPNSACSVAAALKFLHELQVYQVELDLQHEQLEERCQELNAQPNRHIEIYDDVAVALLSVDRSGVITSANAQASRLFAIDQGQLEGGRLDSLLTVDSRAQWQSLLARLLVGAAREACVLYRDSERDSRLGVHLIARRSADRETIEVALVALTDLAPSVSAQAPEVARADACALRQRKHHATHTNMTLDSAAPPATTEARIVALGASAGGLDALEQFFQHVPADSGLAYVVVQHLDPTHKALLVELLQRVTAMPVHEAADGVLVAIDHVYIISPNSELTIDHGRLHARLPARQHDRRHGDYLRRHHRHQRA